MSSSDERPPPKTRKVISATCAIHPGTPGFTNLEVLRSSEDIVLRPHATGACTLILTPVQARELHAWIGELLG